MWNKSHVSWCRSCSSSCSPDHLTLAKHCSIQSPLISSAQHTEARKWELHLHVKRGSLHTSMIYTHICTHFYFRSRLHLWKEPQLIHKKTFYKLGICLVEIFFFGQLWCNDSCFFLICIFLSSYPQFSKMIPDSRTKWKAKCLIVILFYWYVSLCAFENHPNIIATNNC